MFKKLLHDIIKVINTEYYYSVILILQLSLSVWFSYQQDFLESTQKNIIHDL